MADSPAPLEVTMTKLILKAQSTESNLVNETKNTSLTNVGRRGASRLMQNSTETASSQQLSAVQYGYNGGLRAPKLSQNIRALDATRGLSPECVLRTTEHTIHGTPVRSPNRDIMNAEATMAASLYTHMPINTVKAHLRRQEDKNGPKSDNAPPSFRLKQPQVVNIGYINATNTGKGQGKQSFNMQRELLKQRLKDTKKFRQFFEPAPPSSYEKSTKKSTAYGRRIGNMCPSPSELSRPVEVPLSLASPKN